MRRLLESLASGFFICLLAPSLAAATYAGIVSFSTDLLSTTQRSASSYLLSALGVLTGAYILGAIPAFLAGSALPTLRRYLPVVPAAMFTGCLGALAYFATFGSHLLSESHLRSSAWTIGIPAAVGTAIAAYVYARRSTEA
jgi:hypothetical protein